MILLNGHSLAVKQVFLPETEQINLNADAVSTATITVGQEAPTMTIGDWIKDTTPNGIVMVWRVKSVDEDVTLGTRTVQLEDVLAELKDELLFGETTTAQLAGRLGATTCAPTEALTYVFSKQGTWHLGQCVYTDSLPYDFNNVTLYAAVEEICSALLNYYWEIDYTSLPFTLNVKRKTDSIACEMRETRNISTLKKTVDRSQMYTRFYPVGNANIHIGDVNDGVDYVEKNTQIYGVISHQETDNTIRSKEILKAKALELLERHCQPIVTVTISGLELSRSTGEAMDRLVPNTMCRVPLPDLNDVIKERIVKLTWSDAVRRPEEVTVTLANTVRDVQSIISQLKKSGGGGAGAAAKDKEEDHAWFTDTNEYVAMTATALAGAAPDGKPNWSRVAQLMVDGNGIDARVVEAEGELVTHWSAIQATEDDITAEVAARESAVGAITGSSFWMNRDTIQGITGEFETKVDPTTGEKTVVVKSGGGLKIRRNNVEYGLYDNGNLTAGVLVSKINGGTTKILGKNVIIDGDTTINGQAIANALGGQEIGCGNLTVEGMSDIGYADAYVLHSYTDITAANDISASNDIKATGDLYTGGRKVNIVDASVNAATNTLTITKADGTKINFSKAVPTIPVLQGSWAGGVYTVTSTPAPEANLYNYLGKSVYYDAKNDNLLHIDITAAPNSGSQGTVVYPFTYSVQSRYDAGVASVNTGSAGIYSPVITGNYPNVKAELRFKVELSNGVELNYNFSPATGVSNAINNAYTAGVNSVEPEITIGAFANGKATITTNPTEKDPVTIEVGQGTVSWNGNVASGAIAYSKGNGWYSTGATYSVDATSIYEAGYAAGKAAMHISYKAEASGTETKYTFQLVEGAGYEKITADYKRSSHTAGSIRWTPSGQQTGTLPGVTLNENTVSYAARSGYTKYTASYGGHSYSESSLSVNAE